MFSAIVHEISHIPTIVRSETGAMYAMARLRLLTGGMTGGDNHQLSRRWKRGNVPAHVIDSRSVVLHTV